jgi:hypothetical protein
LPLAESSDDTLALASIIGMVAKGVVRQARIPAPAANEIGGLLFFRPRPHPKPVSAIRHVNRVPDVIVRKHTTIRDRSRNRPVWDVAHGSHVASAASDEFHDVREVFGF